MLPTPLLSTYAEYKKDTNSVATWLASTARANGCPATHLSQPWDPQEIPKPSGRLKGKARKQAKEATNQQTSAPKKYVVAIDDFVPLAKFIVAHKPKVDIPTSFIAVLDRVIAVRIGFGEKMVKHGAVVESHANYNHEHFNAILQDVRGVFEPWVSTTKRALSTDRPDHKADSEKLRNRFAGLTVDEPSQASLDAPEVERPKQDPNDKTTYEAEPQVSVLESMFAFWSLMDDLLQLRRVVAWNWRKQTVAMSTIAACAVTTNAAIELARGWVEESASLFELNGGTSLLLDHFFVMNCLASPTSPLSPEQFADPEMLVPVEDLYESYDIADSTCYNAYRILSVSLQIVDNEGTSIPRDGPLSKSRGTVKDREVMSGKEKYLTDYNILTDIIADYLFITGAPAYIVEDQFLSGLREMLKTHQVPLYLVFAAQLSLDLHHDPKLAPQKCAQHVLKEISAMTADLGEYLELHQNDKVTCKDKTSPVNYSRLTTLYQEGQAYLKDPVYQIKVALYKHNHLEPPPSMQPNLLLDLAPVLAGLILFAYRYKIHQTSIDVANAWQGVKPIAQLYHALKREGLLDGDWPDMKAGMSTLSSASFFVGGLSNHPASLLDDYKNFLLHGGMALRSLASARSSKGHRVNTPTNSRAGPRPLKHSFESSEFFYKRLELGQLAGDGGDGQLEDCIYEIVWNHKDLVRYCLEQENKFGEEGRGFSSDNLPRLWEEHSTLKKHEKPHLDSHELIYALTPILHLENSRMAFPFLKLHKTCWTLLREIKRLTYSMLQKEFDLSLRTNSEADLPMLVGYIFQAAVDGRTKFKRRPMEVAAQAFNNLINDKEKRTMIADSMADKGFELKIPGYNVDADDEDTEEDTASIDSDVENNEID